MPLALETVGILHYTRIGRGVYLIILLNIAVSISLYVLGRMITVNLTEMSAMHARVLECLLVAVRFTKVQQLRSRMQSTDDR